MKFPFRSISKNKKPEISLSGVSTDPLIERNAGAPAALNTGEQKTISNNRRKQLKPFVQKSQNQIRLLLLSKWTFDDIAEIFQESEHPAKGWELEIVYNEIRSKKS